MADVKWIKITTNIFDDEKMLLIESLPDSYAIITVWFKLLCLAGKQNNSGVFMMGRIAYTDKMLATIFRMKESTVTMALQTFEQFGMIEIIDGVITIPNWGKHQNLEQLEERRKYQREYQKEYRKKQKLLASAEEKDDKHLRKCLRKHNVNTLDKEEDKDIDIIYKEREIREKESEKKESFHDSTTHPQQIIDLFNSICVSLPSVRSLSQARKKAINARLKTYTIDDFKRCFEMAEASSFLKGDNNRNWIANFDWLIKDSNMPKVLEGNYANKANPAQQKASNRYGNFDVEEAFQAALNRPHDDDEPLKTVGNCEELRERAEALKKEISESS